LKNDEKYKRKTLGEKIIKNSRKDFVNKILKDHKIEKQAF